MLALPAMPWSRVRDVVSPLAVAAAVLGASRLDVLTRAAPVLGVFRGPLGAVLLVTAAILALVRARGTPRSRPAPRVGPLALFLAGAALLVAVGLSYTTRLRVSGDEPHYLLMAQSLWREHDLDLADNFAQEDYLEYTPGPSSRTTARRGAMDGPTRPTAPACRSSSLRSTAWRAAPDAWSSWRSARPWSRRGPLPWPAASAATPRSASGPGRPPWGRPSSSIPSTSTPRPPRRWRPSWRCELLLAPAPTVAMALAAALAASVLPWLHVKMLLVAAAFGVVGVARLRGRPRVAFVLLAVVSAGALRALLRHRLRSPHASRDLRGTPRGRLGLAGARASGASLDRSFGLLPHAPVFLLAFPGLFWLTARWRTTWPVLLVAAAVLAPVLPWRMWWGGQCPPGTIPRAPRAHPGPGRGIRGRGERPGLARWKTPLLAWGVALGAFMASDPGALLLLNRANRPTRVWAALSGDVSIGRYLPSLTLADPVEARVAAVWLAALGVVLALHAVARWSDVLDRWFRGLALPLVLFVAVGSAVDGWASPGVAGRARKSTPGPGRR